MPLLFLKRLDDIIEYQLNSINKFYAEVVQILLCAFFARAACPVERIGNEEYLERSLSRHALVVAHAGERNCGSALFYFVGESNGVVNALGENSVKALDGDFRSYLGAGALLRRDVGYRQSLVLEGEGAGKEIGARFYEIIYKTVRGKRGFQTYSDKQYAVFPLRKT